MSKSKNAFWFLIFDVPIGPTLITLKNGVRGVLIENTTEIQKFRDVSTLRTPASVIYNVN